MSTVNKFRELERKLAEELSKLESMEDDKELAQEIEFEESVKLLIAEYKLRRKTVIDILNSAE